MDPALPPLRYLSFETSLGEEGRITLDAQATLRADDTPALAAALAEAHSVLGWATRHHGGEPGPLDEGHAWDHALLSQPEAGGWHSVSLTLTGDEAMAAALAAAFPGALAGDDAD